MFRVITIIYRLIKYNGVIDLRRGWAAGLFPTRSRQPELIKIFRGNIEKVNETLIVFVLAGITATENVH